MFIMKELAWWVFRKHSPSAMNFTKNHGADEIVQDAVMQGPIPFFDCSVVEKVEWKFSNHHDNEAHFCTQV